MIVIVQHPVRCPVLLLLVMLGHVVNFVITEQRGYKIEGPTSLPRGISRWD